MNKTLVMTSALIALAATGASAQGPSAVRLRLEPGSELSISGTSSMHPFECKTSKLIAYVDVDPGYTKDLTKVARPIASVQVNIVVKTLQCGNKTMDKNMYATLKADKNENQIIKYTLSGYDIVNATSSQFGAKTKGMLNVGGKDKAVAFNIMAERSADGKASAKGEQSLLMSDFGIKPPSFMFGTLKVHDEIKVKFNLMTGPAMIAQIAAAIDGQ